MGPALRPEKMNTELVRDYLELYRNYASIDDDKLTYYIAVMCIFALYAMEIGLQVFRLPGVPERMINRFQEISGIKLKKNN